MPFDGKQLLPWEIAELAHRHGWRDLDLVKIVATALGESKGYTQAYNDNVRELHEVKRGTEVRIAIERPDGTFAPGRLFKVGAEKLPSSTKVIISRDCGIFQISIQAKYVGTQVERDLYNPEHNIRAARRLFDTRITLRKRRRFQPWYAFTKGWATFPGRWVWSLKQEEWILTGEYMHKAVRGVANFYARRLGYPDNLVELNPRPPKPISRPRSEAHAIRTGARPVPNDGQA